MIGGLESKVRVLEISGCCARNLGGVSSGTGYLDILITHLDTGKLLAFTV